MPPFLPVTHESTVRPVPVRPRARAAAAGTVFIVCLTLNACSSNSEATAGSTASVGASNSLVDSVKARGEMRVGVAPNKPNIYQEGTAGEWKGFFADFAQSWAKTLGVKVTFVPTTFGAMVAGLQSEKYDLALDLNDRPARAQVVNFSKGLVNDVGVFVFNEAKVPAKTFDEINDAKYRVCVIQGDANDLGLTDTHPKFQFVRLQQNSACYAALLAGRVDAIFDNWTAAGQFAQQNQGTKILFPPTAIVNEPEAIAINKKYGPADIKELNAAVDQFVTSGGVATAQKASGLVNPVPFAIQPVPEYAATLADQQFGK